MNHIYSLKRSTEVAIWTASRNGSTTGSNITITDASAAPALDLRIYGRTSDGHSVGENGLTVTATGKNILHIDNSVVSREYWGITFTITRNSKGEVTEINANGTASQSLWFALINDNSKVFPQGSYITGCPADGNINTYCIGIYHSISSGISEAYAFDTGSGGIIPQTTDCQRVSIVIKSGITVNNLKFYPMVRVAGSNTFEPFEANTITVTTALPLRSNVDVKDEIDFKAGFAITRISSEGTVLETPVTTPLSSAEITAFNAFALFAGYTNITATDDPTMYIEYQKAAPTRTTRRRTSKKK